MSEDQEVKTIVVSLSEVVPASKNPRKIDDTALAELMSKIEADPLFLLKRPILVNKVNGMMVIYAGNQRYAACKALGLEKIPVRVVDNLNKEHLDHRMLVDNVNRGEFVEDILVSDFQDELGTIAKAIELSDMDFELTPNKADKPKLIYLKLTFQLRSELNTFYKLLDDLQEKYPHETVSGRLMLYLSQLEIL